MLVTHAESWQKQLETILLMWLLTNKQSAPETLMTHRGLTSYAAGSVSKRITDVWRLSLSTLRYDGNVSQV